MIRNIVLDMGMVLMQWEPMLPCLRYAKDPEKARMLNEAVFAHPEWGPMIDGGAMTEEEYFRHASKRLPTPELQKMCLDMSKDWVMDSLYPTTGMRAVLEGLLDKGYRLYVLSNCGRHFHQFSYRVPCFERFSGVLISAEERLMKPDPAIYRRLLDKFSLKAEECLFIDDLPANIAGAKSVGFDGYCFADGDLAKLKKYLDGMDS